jgi:GLPGLI family protein
MKFFLSLFFLSLSLSFVSAQKSYKISYDDERFIDFEKSNIPSRPDMPKSFTSFYTLETTIENSIYYRDDEKTNEDIKKREALGENTRRMRWMNKQNNDLYYKDLKAQKSTDKSNLFGKDFIVIDTLQTWKWKIVASEQREVAGKICMKALYQDSTSILEAWFTPQIVIPNGPHNFGGLPGMILEMRMENRHLVATNIEEIELQEKLSPPDDADVVTREKYEEIREEKQKEMEAMWGGKGRRRG